MPPPTHMVMTTYLAPTAPALEQRVAHHPRAAHAVRVADRDRPAIDVQSLVRNAEPIATVEDLYCEGLVELPEPDIVHAEPESLEQARHGEDGADAHLVGPGARHRHADVPPERSEAASRRHARFHDDACGRAVRKLARVAGGDGTAGEHGLERRQPLERRVGTRAFVALRA